MDLVWLKVCWAALGGEEKTVGLPQPPDPRELSGACFSIILALLCTSVHYTYGNTECLVVMVSPILTFPDAGISNYIEQNNASCLGELDGAGHLTL